MPAPLKTLGGTRGNGNTRPEGAAGGTLSLPIPPQLVEAIAQRLAELLREQISAACAPRSPWLDLNAACAYLGFSPDKLYRLTAARAIPFRKKQGGQRLLFHRGELDQWLERAYPSEGWAP